MAEHDRDPESLGWDAIDTALVPIYGTSEPLVHYAARLHAMIGGDDYLQGVSVYLRESPVAHFHYVTYGFTELYEKEWEDPDWSGFGFELTFRLKKYGEEAPTWPVGLLQNLARYVYRSENGFGKEHYLDRRGKIAIGEETDLCALLFVWDPEFQEVKSPNGRFRFLQVIGITSDEQNLIRRWNAHGFLDAIREGEPRFITDLYRKSMLSNQDLAAELEKKAKVEGSNSSALFVGEAHFTADGENLRVIFGANAIGQVKDLLVPRLGFSRPLFVSSKAGTVNFAPGDVCGWSILEDTVVEVAIPPNLAERLADLLQPKVGFYRLDEAPKIEFEVRRSEISNAEGKVVEVIG